MDRLLLKICDKDSKRKSYRHPPSACIVKLKKVEHFGAKLTY